MGTGGPEKPVHASKAAAQPLSVVHRMHSSEAVSARQSEIQCSRPQSVASPKQRAHGADNERPPRMQVAVASTAPKWRIAHLLIFCVNECSFCHSCDSASVQRPQDAFPSRTPTNNTSLI